jgi:predicted nucleotidyltransferase
LAVTETAIKTGVYISKELNQNPGADWLRKQLLVLSPVPRSIALFGSFTTPQWKDAGDVDLLIVGNNLPRRPSERSAYIQPVVSKWRRFVAENQKVYPQTLSPLFLSEQGWLGSIGMRLSLSECSWILWDDGFLNESIEECRRLRDQGKWRKQTIASGGFFWIPAKDVA